MQQPIRKAKVPELRTLPGVLPGAVYHIAVAWRGSNGGSGAASDTVIHVVEQNGVVGVMAVDPPPNAVGYDVYVGDSWQGMTRQNVTTVAAAKEWVMPPSGLFAGPAPPKEQEPDGYLRNDRLVQRG
jgi:hypothetical protein